MPSTVIKEPESKPAHEAELEQATALEQAGAYAEAAILLETTATAMQPPQQQAALLRAVDNYLKAGDNDNANRLLATIDTHRLPGLDFHRRLLIAEFALGRNRPDEALSYLTDPPAEETAPELVIRYHQLRAEGFRLSGNILESARELGDLDLIISDQEARLDNQLAILQTLATLTDTALDLLQPSPPGIQGGWMELARIIKSHSTRAGALQPLLEGWRERFPSHPAMPELLGGYFEQLKAQYLRPSHLAILLPTSGPYGDAAAALRDGFMAAYYQDSPENRPGLVFYDTSNSADTWPLYRQAVDAGADMIIGPLSKNSVDQLAHAGELDIPVLALNQVPPTVTPPGDLYQFALSPEDEARQVAEKAWLDGHTKAVILTPRGNWGDRIFNAFANRWERLGGLIAEHQSYDSKAHDFSQPIRSMLNIDESYARKKALQRLLGKKLEFEPRRRQDTDFIFLAAKSQKARQLRPQLQFHYAGELPVYTTSHIYSGKRNVKEDQDLEGLMFPDIPWLLVSEGNDPLSRQNLGEILPRSQHSYRRLYAMGMDSYRLLPHLARLQNSSNEMLDGKTGNLYLDDVNHVRRQLVWAEMRAGMPRVIGYAPRMEMDQGGLFGEDEAAPLPESEPVEEALPEDTEPQPAEAGQG
ncbi:MAG: penicillin-binding protein activator [Sedimenticola sp.]